MAGKQGARPPQPRKGTVRYKVWQSIRILRKEFTVPDLICTLQGGRGTSYNNVHKFVIQLEKHGFIGKRGIYRGGRAGQYQRYALVEDCGPIYPVTCPRCEQFITAIKCEKKEKEKETNTEKERGHE